MLIETLKKNISGVRVAIIGDFCLDVYWLADMKRSVLSRETPHYPLPVIEERMSPGGAGNVACNVTALGAGKVIALGLIGNDWRGQALINALQDNGVDPAGLVTCESRVTNAYIKPLRSGISDVIYEDPRLDFENFVLPGKAEEAALLMALDRIAGNIDVLLVCDQMTCGCISPTVREKICELGKNGLKVVVDSRDRIGLYENVIVKPNDVEAGKATGLKDMAEAAKILSEKTGKDSIVTLGDDGCMVCESGNVTHVPVFAVHGPVDICGAGDTFLSAFSCSLACGLSAKDAAKVANAASSVTVQKIGVTGTATIEEIAARF